MVNLLIGESLIKEVEKDLYIYGLNLFFKYFFNCTLAIIFGLTNNTLKETLVFLLFFVSLRSYAGGLHLRKDFLCTAFSLLVLYVVMFIIKNSVISSMMGMIFSLISSLIICWAGPVGNKNKPLSVVEHKYFRKKLVKTVCIQLLIFFVVMFLKIEWFITTMSLNFLFTTLSVIAGKYFRNKKSIIFL